jgi:hypothetical protein
MRFVGSGRGPVRCPGIGIVRSGGAGLEAFEGTRPAADVVILGRGRLGGEFGGGTGAPVAGPGGGGNDISFLTSPGKSAE